MSLKHLTYYTENGLTAALLAQKLGCHYWRANRLVNGRVFLTVDEYKTLSGGDPDMEHYLQMKHDFELHSNKRIKIDDTGLITVFFYPNFHHVAAINDSYDILWRASCLNKYAAIRLWNAEKIKFI